MCLMAVAALAAAGASASLRPRTWFAGQGLAGFGRRVSAPPATRRNAAATTSTFKDMTVAELKEELRKRSLPLAGKKADLIARLEAEGSSESPPEKEAAPPARAPPVSSPMPVPTMPVPSMPVPTGGGQAAAGGMNFTVPDMIATEPYMGPDDPRCKPYGGGNDTRTSPWGTVPRAIWDGMEFADDQGKMLDGSGYMCVDGVVRKGDPYSIDKDEDFYEWLTEWLVAARTGQLRDDDHSYGPHRRPWEVVKEMEEIERAKAIKEAKERKR